MTQTLKIDHWLYDPATHRLETGVGGETRCITLENRQGQVLNFLCANGGRDISKDELLQLWSPRVVGEDALYVCIANLRKALGDQPRAPAFIKTVPGYGYRFLPPVTPAAPPSRFKRLWLTASVAGVCALAGVAGLLLTQEPSTNPDLLAVSDDELSSEIPVTIADDFRQARFLLTQGGERFNEALVLLRDIMRREPDFAESFALAAYHQGQAMLSGEQVDMQATEIEGWIETALTLAPDNLRAQLAKANLAFDTRWDFDRAQELYRQALASPELQRPERVRERADLYFDYARFLLAMGDYEQALQYTHQYQDLNPEGYSIASVAWIETMSGRYDQALAHIEKLTRLDPHNAYYHVSRQAIFELRGDAPAAYQELRWMLNYAGYSAQDLDHLDGAFRQGGLAAVYHWLATTDPKHLNIGQYRPPLSLARYAIGAGDLDLAMAQLQAAVAQRQVEVLWLAVDPKYAPLHSRADYRQLLADIGLSRP